MRLDLGDGPRGHSSLVDLTPLSAVPGTPGRRQHPAAGSSPPIADVEDAVVSACAEQQDCAFIITRNCRDFAQSSIAALTPGEAGLKKRKSTLLIQQLDGVLLLLILN